ncbi:hypothetical protein Ndes2526B_g05189 [Nannochloris sp. 'desiccata']|nr:hypothetical protein NADE_008221 [Chlorella desiccata (nom. nud.)]
MVVSKRVSNAKSERHYRNTGPLAKKKEVSFFESMRKRLSANYGLVLFFLFMTVFSGIVTFFMNEKPTRGGMFATSDDDF